MVTTYWMYVLDDILSFFSTMLYTENEFKSIDEHTNIHKIAILGL